MVFGKHINKKPRFFMLKFSAKFITKSAVIAAMYTALSYVLHPISFGPLQFRAAEAFVMLPSNAGGCARRYYRLLLTNLSSPYGAYDALFGTLATLIAALLTMKINNKWLAALPPVLVNAAVLPLMWYLLGSEEAYFISLLSVTASEVLVVYAIGVPLVIVLKRSMPSVATNKKFLVTPENSDRDLR
jgi:Predicted membrane protein